MSDLLITHRIPASVTPLGTWLADAADRITLVTASQTHADYRDAFPRVYAVPDYPDNPAVETLLDEVCRQGPVSALVHVTEDDILRCARVRERAGVPGLLPADALPWRDKLAMKQRVSAAGIPTASFVAPRGAEEARAFARRSGYPVVVKPRLGYASHGVVVVHGDDELTAEVAGRPPDDLLVESFVPGRLFHVDGFTMDGKVQFVMPARYLNDCLAFQEAQPLGSIQLDPGTAAWDRLSELTDRVVAALTPLDFTPFHLEAFERPDTGEFVFGEVGCRLGGAHIMETLTYATGVNPARLWIRHQLGLEAGFRTRLVAGTRRYGWLLIPPRAGRLLAVREPDGVPFVKDFIVKTRIPRHFDGAHGSTDSVIAFVVEGDDSDQLERHLEECVDLARDLLEWEEPHGDL